VSLSVLEHELLVTQLQITTDPDTLFTQRLEEIQKRLVKFESEPDFSQSENYYEALTNSCGYTQDLLKVVNKSGEPHHIKRIEKRIRLIKSDMREYRETKEMESDQEEFIEFDSKKRKL